MTDDTTDPDGEDEKLREHLEDVDEGCGCAEVWEYLSDQRADDCRGGEP